MHPMHPGPRTFGQHCAYLQAQADSRVQLHLDCFAFMHTSTNLPGPLFDVPRLPPQEQQGNPYSTATHCHCEEAQAFRSPSPWLTGTTGASSELHHGHQAPSSSESTAGASPGRYPVGFFQTVWPCTVAAESASSQLTNQR